MKKAIALILSLGMAFSLAACSGSSDEGSKGSTSSESGSAEVTSEQPAGQPDEVGFVELPIFEDEEAGFMNVNAVYFEPVPMSNGQDNIEDYNLHLECDVSALDNDLGYGLGDWVPYLTVDYEVISDNGQGDVAASGTFMVMSASDGPHYGANIKLEEADTYAVKFTFHNPEENGYLIHLDAKTGPGGTFDEYFADGNLEVYYEGWEYTPQEWN